MVETEIRGRLTKREFDELLKLLQRDGKPKDHYPRLSVDISPGFDPKTRTWNNQAQTDLRLKKSGKSEKISLKIGEYHLQERKEIDVKLQEGELMKAIDLFVSLGFDSGMIYFWESWEFEYQSFEVKLSKHNEVYYTWEIEAKEGNDPAVLARQLFLKPYNKEEYKQAIDYVNQSIHRQFSVEAVGDLMKQFKLSPN